jgi:hypothetical protein
MLAYYVGVRRENRINQSERKDTLKVGLEIDRLLVKLVSSYLFLSNSFCAHVHYFRAFCNTRNLADSAHAVKISAHVQNPANLKPAINRNKKTP